MKTIDSSSLKAKLSTVGTFVEQAHLDAEGCAFAGKSASRTRWFWLEQAAHHLAHRRQPRGSTTKTIHLCAGLLMDSSTSPKSCLDRHLSTHRRNKAALIWEGEPGDQRVLTILNCIAKSVERRRRCASWGSGWATCVIVYMPMVPELVIAVLACARIGATHSVILVVFPQKRFATALTTLVTVAVVTADGGYRAASGSAPTTSTKRSCIVSVKHVVVVSRTGQDISMHPGRDHFWTDLVRSEAGVCATPAIVPSEHPLFSSILGDDRQAKGVVHSTGGYATQVAFTANMCSICATRTPVGCTADVSCRSRVTRISSTVADKRRHRRDLQKAPQTRRIAVVWGNHRQSGGVTIFYTAPTAIRAVYARWVTAASARSHNWTFATAWHRRRTVNPPRGSWYLKRLGAVAVRSSTPGGRPKRARRSRRCREPPSQSLALVRSRCRELRSKWCTKTAVAAAKRRRLRY